MSRYIFTPENKPNISVAYGYDVPLQEFFVQVYDSDLEVDYENDTDDDIAFKEARDPSGEGMILNVSNYMSDEKATTLEMVGILKEYGCPNNEHLSNMMLDLPI